MTLQFSPNPSSRANLSFSASRASFLSVIVGPAGPAGTDGITDLTGDVTATGPGAVAATLTTLQPSAHSWSGIQTFTQAPVFTDAAGSRTALGLVIGTNVQAYDATLLSLAALGTAADKIAYTTAADTWAEAAITAAGRSMIAAANAAAQSALLDATIAPVFANVTSTPTTLAGYGITDAIGNAIVTTRGDIITRNATVPIRLAAGTTGQYLKTLGSAADPIYDNPVVRFGDYVAGRWYNAAGSASPVVAGTLAMVADTLYAVPFICKKNQAFDRIGIRVDTAGTATTMRLGLYNYSAGVPTSLIEEANTVDAPTSAVIKTGIITQTLVPGFYYAVILLNGTATLRATATTVAAYLEMHGFSDDGTDFLPTTQITGAHAYAALPANFPAVTRASAVTPIGVLRAA